jgi:TetR/AcrR family transcriptional repressor of nem operon
VTLRDTAKRLMDLAEARMREAGYHGFSFRDIGADAGITSASVHHHFPTKAGLAAAIMQRHKARFAASVAPRPGETEQDVAAAYRAAFRDALHDTGGMCLGGMLGAESGGLPPLLHEEVEQFFQNCIADLASRIGGPDAHNRAFAIMALLEGGLILAQVYKDAAAFDHATAALAKA